MWAETVRSGNPCKEKKYICFRGPKPGNPLDNPGQRETRRSLVRLSLVKSDDPVAAQWYAENLQVHEAALRAWLRVKFPFLSDRDNVVQEALTRVWRMRQQHEIASPKALLFTTARNLAIDELRRRNIAPIESLEENPDLSVLDEGAAASDAVALKQEIQLLIQAMQSLPERCRQVLTLRRIHGLSHREIAAKLNISEATVETHVCNGLRGCTRYLARFGLP